MEEIKINKLSTRQFLILLGVIVVIGAGLIFGLTANKSKAVATVGGKSITEAELYEVLADKFGKIELNALIEEKIIDLELKKAKKEVTKADVKQELQKYYDAFGDEESLKTAIAMQGMTLDDFERSIKKTLAISLLFDSNIDVEAADIEDYYNENKLEFYNEAVVDTHVILVETEAEAEELREELEGGGDFAALAKEHSTHASAESSGRVGFITADVLEDELAKATFALEVDEISQPIKTDAGYHIVKVTEKREAKQDTLEESQAAIEKLLINEKVQEQFRPWYNEKVKEHKVKNNLK